MLEILKLEMNNFDMYKELRTKTRITFAEDYIISLMI